MKTLKNLLKESSECNKYGFVIIKPGFLHLSKQILETFKDHGWEVDQIKTKKLLHIEAKGLYKVHKNEDFYKDLCNYMSSGLTTGILLKKQCDGDEFEEIGKIKDGIRKEYEESDMRNVIHSSDSLESFENEAKYYFQIIK